MEMKPTLEQEAKGMKAYEQARAFERLRSWRLPVTFCFFPLLAAGSGAMLWSYGQATLAWLNFIAAIGLAWMARFQWKQLVARHANNLRLLANLRKEYGEELPWVQVENHFAALAELRREIAEGRQVENGKR
jgi:hypothetical protein